jgi:CheY-like chemotaxis protein
MPLFTRPDTLKLVQNIPVARSLTAILLSSNPEILSVVKQGLDPIDVENYATGADAVGRLIDPERPPPKLVVIDFSTASDALHFVSFVKSSGPTSHLPVIAVIEEGNNRLAMEKDRIGLADILVKPFTAADVARVAQAVT